ncbi:MAG: hypothetical protein ACOC9P_00825 [bacterium]
MARTLFLIATALSALFLVAVVAAWIASHNKEFDGHLARGDAVYELTVINGAATLSMRMDRSISNIRIKRHAIGRLGLHYGIDERWTSSTRSAGIGLFYWRIGMPLWLPALLAVLLLARVLMLVLRWRRERARRQGTVPDLRVRPAGEQRGLSGVRRADHICRSV